MEKSIIKFLVIVVLSAPFIGYAKTYKWVDENGVLHFSDSPRPQDVRGYKALEINVEKTKPSAPEKAPIKVEKEDFKPKNVEVIIELLKQQKNATLDTKAFLADFKSIIPKPHWWDSITYPGDGVHSEGDVLSYWQSKKRCCVDKEVLTQNNREFYKAAYEGIEKYPEKKHLVTKAMWLMASTASERESRVNLRKLLLNNFFYYGQSLDKCANCEPANTIARCTKDLARSYYSDGKKEKAISLMEFVLDEREEETSLWVLTEIYTFLADLYLKTSVNETRLKRLKRAYIKLEPYKSTDSGKRRFPKFDSIYKRIIKSHDKPGKGD